MAVRTWWKFSADMCDEPKIAKLARTLEIPVVMAAGTAALLYAWAVDAADDCGSLNDYTVKAIESACRWEGVRGALLDALHASGILMGDLVERDEGNPLRVADWETVAGKVLGERKHTRERQRKFRENSHSVTRDITRDVTEDITRPKNKELRTKN